MPKSIKLKPARRPQEETSYRGSERKDGCHQTALQRPPDLFTDRNFYARRAPTVMTNCDKIQTCLAREVFNFNEHCFASVFNDSYVAINSQEITRPASIH